MPFLAISHLLHHLTSNTPCIIIQLMRKEWFILCNPWAIILVKRVARYLTGCRMRQLILIILYILTLGLHRMGATVHIFPTHHFRLWGLPLHTTQATITRATVHRHMDMVRIRQLFKCDIRDRILGDLLHGVPPSGIWINR